MYYLIVWDKDLASTGQGGCIDKIDIPLDVATFLFRLDAEQYPILSSLSFIDYDMFSGSEINSLIGEMFSASSIKPLISEVIARMVGLMLKAKSLGKTVLFDPFKLD